MESLGILLGKAIVIAILAGLVAPAPLFIAGAYEALAGESPGWTVQSALATWSVALLGSFAIGLPIALLTHFLAAKQMARFPSTLPLAAGLSIVVMTIASFVIAGPAGIFLFGLPAAVAALTYAVLGQVWVIRPLRDHMGNGNRDIWGNVDND